MISTTPTEGKTAAAAKRSAKLTPVMLNHAAWVTHDVEATADFFMRIMGMELASTVYDDRVPSTGDDFPYFHIFFRMQDGSTIAFFECIGLPERPEASHAAYTVFDHIALEAKDRDEVDQWAEWLKENGIDIVGPVDHKGLIYSIYFFDPNGIRMEITTPLDADWNRHTEQGLADLRAWISTKNEAAANNADVGEALLRLIRGQRKRYDKA